MNRQTRSFTVNLGLLLSFLAIAFSGLWIQIHYHMLNPMEGGIHSLTSGLSYPDWTTIHKIAILFASLFIVIHVHLHWKWYMTIISKRMIYKNIQVFTLTAVFLLTAVSGYIPWFIYLTRGEEILRKNFIEIHDKIVWFLIIYLVLHLSGRLKWFFTTFRKLKNRPGKRLGSATPG